MILGYPVRDMLRSGLEATVAGSAEALSKSGVESRFSSGWRVEFAATGRNFRSGPGSRSDFGRGGKSGLHMAAGSGDRAGECRRRGDPTESATENIPPVPNCGMSKGEMVGQEPTVPGGDIGMHGKPPAEQDQIREEFRMDEVHSGPRRPVSDDSRVGCSDKWLPLLRESEGKTEFGLSAHSANSFMLDGSVR